MEQSIIILFNYCLKKIIKEIDGRYISWDDYFMAIAFLSAERSKDPNRQVLFISDKSNATLSVVRGGP